MIMSMTGYASSQFIIGEGDLSLLVSATIKSVNGKYFDINSRIPSLLAPLEHACNKICRRELIRGTVSLFISVIDTAGVTVNYQLQDALIDSYAHFFKYIATRINDTAYTPKVADFLRISEVFQGQNSELSENQAAQFLKGIEGLVSQVVKQRLSEGVALQQDLMERIAILDHQVTFLESYGQEAMTRHTSELDACFKQYDFESAAAEGCNSLREQYKEAIRDFLDKRIIHEEIVRLRSHIAHVKSLIQEPEALELGKRIDFFAQEMLREVNTINAKSHDAEITHAIIASKIEIEKIREQAQNIV